MNLPANPDQQASVLQQVQATQQRLAERRLAVVQQAHTLRTTVSARVSESLPPARLVWLAAGTAGVGLWIYKRNKDKVSRRNTAAPEASAPAAQSRRVETLTAVLMLANSALTYVNMRQRVKK